MTNCFSTHKTSIDHTYKNGDYIAKLDHILVRKNNFIKVKTFDIISDSSNLSDHHPIMCEILLEKSDWEEKKILKNFQNFDWKDDMFIDRYKLLISENVKNLIDKISMKEINSKSDTIKLIDEIHDTLPRILLKSARSSEKKLKIKNSRVLVQDT